MSQGSSRSSARIDSCDGRAHWACADATMIHGSLKRVSIFKSFTQLVVRLAAWKSASRMMVNRCDQGASPGRLKEWRRDNVGAP